MVSRPFRSSPNALPHNTSILPDRTTPDVATTNTRNQTPTAPPPPPNIVDFINELTADLGELSEFYNISLSPTRIHRTTAYVTQRLHELSTRFPQTSLTPDAQTDWLLAHAYLTRTQTRLRVEGERLEELAPLLGGWAGPLVGLCERRQKVVPTGGKEAAAVLAAATGAVREVAARIVAGRGGDAIGIGPVAAFRAAAQVEELGERLKEFFGFHAGYDPVFTWWTRQPWEELARELVGLVAVLRPGDRDAIVGQPIGREGLVAELETEGIPYTPEELLRIGEREYKWCEREAVKASRERGFGDDWMKLLEAAKNQYVEPGKQTEMVHELAEEALEYVTKNDMVTIPPIAAECWRTYMMTPAQQKVNPFFLGGTSIIVSYPTCSMSHEEKLMVMRGNSRPLSRSTVFHELLPGHHLQFHYMPRSKPHRQLFETPFWIEGWAFYWELLLWDRGDFAVTPEEKMGMLFWHMHRCARIVFSVKFHLGEWTPAECVEFLVRKVGHERATAEGEVRRSFNGEDGPLYQAGYMLGALQIYALRKEVVDVGGLMSEKEFHDRVMKENNMPIELLRALLKGETLDRNHKPSWRFYDL